MAQKLNAKSLKRLVLETVKEIRQEKKSSKKVSRRTELNNIIENTKKIVEEADPSKLDPARFPPRLRQAGKAGKEDADADAVGGANDGNDQDDVVGEGSWSGAVGELMPSQNSMDVEKLCNFFVSACRVDADLPAGAPFEAGPGGKIGCIISSDGYIMDGHHRWGALCMYDPKTKVGPDLQLAFPAVELIAVLNTITVNLTGRTKGKPGKFDLTKAFTEPVLRDQLQKFLDNPGSCWACDKDGPTLTKCLQTFANFEGDPADMLDVVMKKIMTNLASSALEPVSDGKGVFAREDMPVISPNAGHVKKAAAMLTAGQVDINPPYAKEDVEAPADEQEDEQEEANESRKRGNADLIVERWNQLAGLIKD